jgi:hypothetical protein
LVKTVTPSEGAIEVALVLATYAYLIHCRDHLSLALPKSNQFLTGKQHGRGYVTVTRKSLGLGVTKSSSLYTAGSSDAIKLSIPVIKWQFMVPKL